MYGYFYLYPKDKIESYTSTKRENVFLLTKNEIKIF